MLTQCLHDHDDAKDNHESESYRVDLDAVTKKPWYVEFIQVHLKRPDHSDEGKVEKQEAQRHLISEVLELCACPFLCQFVFFERVKQLTDQVLGKG